MALADVAQALGSRFDCPRCHAPTAWDKVARPAQRQNSIIHRLQCARCGERIVAKVAREGEAGDGNAQRHLRREYETLRALQHRFLSDESCGTLEPLGYMAFSGAAILVTRLFRGQDLLRHMKTLDVAGMAKACHVAGVWLRRLHESGQRAAQMKPLEVADRLAYLDETYGAALRGSATMKAGYRRLQQEGSRIGALAFHAVRLHGDFKPENMLCDGTRYVGLDVQWRTTGPAVYDLAPFLNHLWLAVRRFGLLDKRQYDQLETEFLAGYGAVGDIRILRWAQLYFSLCQLGGYHRRGRLAMAYANWQVRPLVRKLVAQLV